jgi:glycosyltransferase involved in cell wall biosynthesis
MTASVIITTYNQPAWLEKVLWGYAAQSVSNFQLVVADDGSAEETRAVISRAKADFGDRLKHIWHEDEGFRKCEILNRAIVDTKLDYLIFTDGDCIPRHDFVARHLALAEPGHYLSGGVVWLPRELSHLITRADIVEGRLTDSKWLRTHGWSGGRRRLRMIQHPLLATALDVLTPTYASFNSGNASVWREALLRVNGFEMEMGYGGLDRALGERLRNSGVKAKQVRHRAVAFHLDHDRPYRNREGMKRNLDILERIRQSGEVRARKGIEELTTANGHRP